MNILDTNDSSNTLNLRDHFLVAMPSLNDSSFSHSVTYICDHNAQGAMGLVINHPMNLQMKDVFKQLELNTSGLEHDMAVLTGGPVNPQQGLIIHRDEGTWQSTLHVTQEICLTASKDIMQALAQGKGPASAQLALGYAGWGPGQLEAEILENSWLTIPADSRILFDTPVDERWQATAKHIGIDLSLISSVSGRA